jgi:hypothetical protein
MTDILGVYDQMVYDDVAKKYLPATKLDMLGYNLLDANSASFEGGVGIWTGGTGTETLASVVPPSGALNGSKALSLANNAPPQAQYGTQQALTGLVPIVAGARYTLMYWMRASLVPATFRMYLQWIAADGSTIVLSEGGASPYTPDSVSAWTQYIRQSVAPAGASYVRMFTQSGLPSPMQPNFLSADDASFENTIGGWISGGNSTLLRSTAQALDGVASLAVTSVAAGDMWVSGASNSVVASKTYSVIAFVRAAGTVRQTRSFLRFWRADNSFVDAYSSFVNDSSTAWTQYNVSGTAMVDAVRVTPYVQWQSVGAAGEVHYVDQAGVFPETKTIWTPGQNGVDTHYIDQAGIYQGWQTNWTLT